MKRLATLLFLISLLSLGAWAQQNYIAPTVYSTNATTGIGWTAGTVNNGGHPVSVAAGTSTVTLSEASCAPPSYTGCNFVYANSSGTVAVTTSVATAAASGNTLLAYIETGATTITQIVYPWQSGTIWTGTPLGVLPNIVSLNITAGPATGAGTAMNTFTDTAGNTGTGAVLNITTGIGSAAGSASNTGVLTVAPAAQASGTSPSAGNSALTVIAGAGGAQSGTTSGGGNGGTITETGGVGGIGGSSSGTAGTGGAVTFSGGAGGAGPITGGTGGAATLAAGAGGNGSSAGGSGGNTILKAGAAGTGGTGVAGKVQVEDAADNTKIFALATSGLTTGTTVNATLPAMVAGTNAGGLPVVISCGSTGSGNQTCSAAAATVKTTIIDGESTLSSNAAVITFPNSFAYTSTTSYFCVANDVTTRANPVQMVPTSGATATITNTTGATDVIQWICVGN